LDIISRMEDLQTQRQTSSGRGRVEVLRLGKIVHQHSQVFFCWKQC